MQCSDARQTSRCVAKPRIRRGWARSHGSVALRPIEWQRETPWELLVTERACLLCNVHVCRACDARMPPLPNHTLSEDGAWSHGSVASRSIEWQRETPERSSFLSVRACYALFKSAGHAVLGCLPQPNHASGEDEAWSNGSVASRSIEWQRETPGRVPFLSADACNARYMSAGHAMLRCLPRPNHRSGEDGAWSHWSVASRFKNHLMTWVSMISWRFCTRANTHRSSGGNFNPNTWNGIFRESSQFHSIKIYIIRQPRHWVRYIQC